MAQLSETPDVPDLGRRQFMNLLLLGAAGGTVLGALYPIVKYFIPPSSGGAGGGVIAKDALGNDVVVSEFLASHNVGERVLTQGLKGDPTYLVVESAGRNRQLWPERRLHSPRLRCALERQRKQIYVPLPRLAVQQRRQSCARPRTALSSLGSC